MLCDRILAMAVCGPDTDRFRLHPIVAPEESGILFGWLRSTPLPADFNSGRLRHSKTSTLDNSRRFHDDSDFERLHDFEKDSDSRRLLTTPDDSGRLSSTPDDSGRLQAVLDDSRWLKTMLVEPIFQRRYWNFRSWYEVYIKFWPT